MHKLLFLSVVSLVLLISPTNADNWGHWRGPTGNGTTLGNPPTQWSNTTNVKWKAEIPGRGSGSPVVWGNQVFVVTAVVATADDQENRSNTSQERSGGRPSGGVRSPAQRRRGFNAGDDQLTNLRFKILCFDRQGGELLWQQTATEATPHQRTHSTNGFSSASPCTDGSHVYAHFGSRGLFCYTMDGKLKWKRDDFGKMNTKNDFGEGSSPTIAGDKIIVPWDHEGQSYLYALDKTSGNTIWKAKRDEPSCWATPLVVQHQGKHQIIMNGQTAARSYDLDSGDELWRCGGQAQRPVASAVADNALAFVGSGFQGSFLGAFRLDGKGNIEGTASVAWVIDRDGPDIASPLLSNGRIYFHKGKSGQLSCVDAATGKPHYMASRIPGIEKTYASPIAVGGHVYLTGRSGTTVVIEDADELKIVSSNSVGETVDATPAAVDNELFLRGEKHLFCIAAP